MSDELKLICVICKGEHATQDCPKRPAESSFAAPHGSARPREFYILSLNHSPADGCALWWGANDAGYTKNLTTAGRYSEERVKGMAWYYDDGTATRAVPCDTVEANVMPSVDWNKARKLWAQVPNSVLGGTPSEAKGKPEK